MDLVIKAQNDWRNVGVSSCKASQISRFDCRAPAYWRGNVLGGIYVISM